MNLRRLASITFNLLYSACFILTVMYATLGVIFVTWAYYVEADGLTSIIQVQQALRSAWYFEALLYTTPFIISLFFLIFVVEQYVLPVVPELKDIWLKLRRRWK